MLQPAALITSKARNNRSKHLRSKIKSPKPETHTTKGPNWSKNREGSNTEIIQKKKKIIMAQKRRKL